MHEKMQGSGLTEIIPFICISATHLKRPWCWERLKAGGEGDDRGGDGWRASPTRWTWVWVNSGSWWWTGRPGVLWFMGSQRVGHDWATELNWVPSLVHPAAHRSLTIPLEGGIWSLTREWEHKGSGENHMHTSAQKANRISYQQLGELGKSHTERICLIFFNFSISFKLFQNKKLT